MGTSLRTPLLLGTLVLLFSTVVAATSAGPTRLALDLERDDRQEQAADRGWDDEQGEERRGEDPGVPEPPTPEEGGSLLLSVLLLAVGVAALAVLAVVLLQLRLVRRRRRLAGDVPPRHGLTLDANDEDESLDDVDLLGSALDAGLRQIDRGSARNAIVEAWLHLEEAAELRTARRPADTPTEFAARALSSYRLDPGTLDRFAQLYEEARFSEHPVTEEHREQARDCLVQLLAALPHRGAHR